MIQFYRINVRNKCSLYDLKIKFAIRNSEPKNGGTLWFGFGTQKKVRGPTSGYYYPQVVFLCAGALLPSLQFQTVIPVVRIPQDIVPYLLHLYYQKFMRRFYMGNCTDMLKLINCFLRHSLASVGA